MRYDYKNSNGGSSLIKNEGWFKDDKIITSASGVWKILKIKPSNLGPGG